MNDEKSNEAVSGSDLVRERLPKRNQDAAVLASDPHHPYANANTILRPLAESEGVVLKETHPHSSNTYFGVRDDGLVAVSEWSFEQTADDIKTGIDAVVAFAHAYGHGNSTLRAVPIEDAPEVFRRD